MICNGVEWISLSFNEAKKYGHSEAIKSMPYIDGYIEKDEDVSCLVSTLCILFFIQWWKKPMFVGLLFGFVFPKNIFVLRIFL